MRIVVGSDHAGFPLKASIIDHIRKLGHKVVDVGSYDASISPTSRKRSPAP